MRAKYIYFPIFSQKILLKFKISIKICFRVYLDLGGFQNKGFMQCFCIDIIISLDVDLAAILIYSYFCF